MNSSWRTPLLVGLAWGAIVLTGFYWMQEYESIPGSAITPPQAWPHHSQIIPSSGRATLVLAVHPHCPCTRATMAELAQILTRCRTEVAAHVLFFQPSEFADDWVETDLWNIAAAIPGVQVFRDKDGIEARRFGAVTSGQVILYDLNGQRVFRGGITRSRGHVGTNAGRHTVISLISLGTAELTETPVYGCPLFSSAVDSPPGS